MTQPQDATAGPTYARRLQRLSTATWKTQLDVQAPYRWHLRYLQLGRVLDVGCGIGRNLAHLQGNGIGVDHNPTSVMLARFDGWTAYCPAEFLTSPHARSGAFDSLLLAHVVEHLSRAQGEQLMADYVGYLRPGGRIIVITPQERGYASDDTHIRFVNLAESCDLLAAAGATVERTYSFPFTRAIGKVFPYNEFVAIGRLPSYPGVIPIPFS